MCRWRGWGKSEALNTMGRHLKMTRTFKLLRICSLQFSQPFRLDVSYWGVPLYQKGSRLPPIPLHPVKRVKLYPSKSNRSENNWLIIILYLDSNVYALFSFCENKTSHIPLVYSGFRCRIHPTLHQLKQRRKPHRFSSWLLTWFSLDLQLYQPVKR